MQGYPPPPGGYGPPPGGNPPPPPGGYGAPPGSPGSPPGGYYAQPGYGPPPPGYGAPHAMVTAPYGVDPLTGIPFSDKQKIVAALLQFFAGGFGAGRWYTGHTNIAIAQILVVWLTCGAGFLWPLIDGIMMITGKVPDAQGRPLRD